jgi:Fic family protein
MRRDQLAPERQQFLVPCDDRPNVLALVAPPTPRAIPGAERHHAAIAMANQAIGRLEGAMSGFPNADLLTRTLARREAVQSSQIEGTQADLPQLLTYEATQGLDGLPTDVQVTERYVRALQHGLDAVREHGSRGALTCELLDALHAILMQDAPLDFPRGRYRTTQVWIGSGRIEDAAFVPAPARYIPTCMAEMEQSILQYAPHEDEQSMLSLVPQLAIAHAQFETIHPYQDGNGRVGRLLLPLILAAEGLPPLYLSGPLLRHRSAYYAALASVQLRGDWGPWLSMLARAVVEASDDTIAIARDLTSIQATWSHQLGSFRADSATRSLPAFLVGHPVVSVKQVAVGLSISVPAANAAIGNLLELGILRMRDENKKWGRVFLAPAILERLAAPPSSRFVPPGAH